MKKKVALDPTRGRGGPKRKLSTRAIKAATGLSTQRIQQRLARGESGEEIVAAVEVRKRSEQAALADERAHHSRRGGTAAPAPLAFSTRRKAESDAELKAMELRRRRGELVEVSQINLWMSACTIGARQILEDIEYLGDALALEQDAHKIRALLRGEVERGLRTLEGFGITMTTAVSVAPMDLSLPSEVQQAIRVIAKYSISLAGGGK